MKSFKDVRATTKITKDLVAELDAATIEKGVEHAYWGAIKATFKNGLPSDADQTDGFIRLKYIESELFLLMEFKFNKHLIIVDFPAPFSPISPRMVPFGKERLIFCIPVVWLI